MSYKNYALFRLLVVVVVTAFGAWAGISGNFILLIPVVFVIAIVMLAMKRRMNEVVVDERINTVAWRASRLAFLTFVILAVIVGITLTNLAENTADVRFAVGLTLNYSGCALMMFYWLGYAYYNRKLGGKE